MFKKPTHSFVKPQARNPNSNTFPLKAVLAEVLGTALLANAVAMGTDRPSCGPDLSRPCILARPHLRGAAQPCGHLGRLRARKDQRHERDLLHPCPIGWSFLGWPHRHANTRGCRRRLQDFRTSHRVRRRFNVRRLSRGLSTQWSSHLWY